MELEEIIYRTHELYLPKNSYIVCGGGPLAAVDLRPADDIDLFVTPELFEELANKGWQQQQKPDSNTVGLVFDTFEAHRQWIFHNYVADFDDQLKRATYYDDIPFMNLTETKRWKQVSGRPKDLKDISLIDDYLSQVS